MGHHRHRHGGRKIYSPSPQKMLTCSKLIFTTRLTGPPSIYCRRDCFYPYLGLSTFGSGSQLQGDRQTPVNSVRSFGCSDEAGTLGVHGRECRDKASGGPCRAGGSNRAASSHSGFRRPGGPGCVPLCSGVPHCAPGDGVFADSTTHLSISREHADGHQKAKIAAGAHAGASHRHDAPRKLGTRMDGVVRSKRCGYGRVQGWPEVRNLERNDSWWRRRRRVGCVSRVLLRAAVPGDAEREFFIDNLLVRIHLIIVMIRWTGLAPWEFELLFQVALHLPS